MTTVNNRFWRVDPNLGTDQGSVVESHVLTSPAELVAKLRRFDGIVVGTWDPDAEEGNVHALGIVREVNGPSAVVDWRQYSLTLRPSAQGGTQWKNRPFFKFADPVAARYRLMDHFNDAFGTASGGSGNFERTIEALQAPAADYAHRVANPVNFSEATAPQCNRVAPDGQFFATSARGMFMGNRTSPPRWLVCDLHFKRELKEPRQYTKLFFLDEAVALAAGHRPCNTCRRDRYQAYLEAVRTEIDVRDAAELDARLNVARKSPRMRSPIASIPDGAFIALSEDDYRLKWSGGLHRWTPAGYIDPTPLSKLHIDATAAVLTPGPALAALRNGYSAELHASAVQALRS